MFNLLQVLLLPVALLCLVVSCGLAQGQDGGIHTGSMPQGGVLRSEPLPDLNAFTADGKPVKLRVICQINYTMLSSCCLTCSEFRRNSFCAQTAIYPASSRGGRRVPEKLSKHKIKKDKIL